MFFKKKISDEQYMAGLQSLSLVEKQRWEARVYHDFWKVAKKIPSKGLGEDGINIVYQEAIEGFIRGIRLQKFDAKSSLKTYFSSIFNNKLNTMLKKEYNKNTVELPDELKDTLKDSNIDLNISFTFESFQKAINFLPEKCQKLVRFVFEGYTSKEIASLLGIQPNTANKNKRECLHNYQLILSKL